MISDLIGKKVGRLTVGNFERRKYQVYYECTCDCGNVKWIRRDKLVNEITNSCGCLKRGNLIGKKFGKLTVRKRKVINERGYYICECDCGELITVRVDLLKGNSKTSCGCVEKERAKVSFSRNRIRNIYKGIVARCTDLDSPSYERYGARGIEICIEWRNDFESFYLWAINNGYSDELTIDRIDNNVGYTPKNCRWATPQEQANNTRRNVYVMYKGEKMTMAQYARSKNSNYSKIARLIKLGRIPEVKYLGK